MLVLLYRIVLDLILDFMVGDGLLFVWVTLGFGFGVWRVLIWVLGWFGVVCVFCGGCVVLSGVCF